MRLHPDARPRLRPAAVLLDRPGGELQVGLDTAWRLPDPGGRWRRLLSRLDGRRSWRQLSRESTWGEPSDVLEVLESLAAAGLAELDPARRPATRSVRILGVGPLATVLAERLRAGHVGRTSGRAPLTVVVADTVEVDRTVAADLVRHGVPHLLVRPRPTGAVVGPLVVPGRTACLGCTDLTRRDADPAWPALLAQLEYRSVADLATSALDWAAAVTATQVLAFLDQKQPDVWGATWELDGYAMAWRSWSVHPECGCRWPGTHVAGWSGVNNGARGGGG